MTKDVDFEMETAQALRRSHCDRKGQEHECVGQVTIKRGQVCLDCRICGSGEYMPGWNSWTAATLGVIFGAAGIDWESIDLEAKIRAIREFKNMVQP